MHYILDFAAVSVFLPCIPAVLRYRAYNRELRLISIYIILCAIVEVISHLLWSYKINNLPLLHLYVPVTFTALFLFYKTLLGNLLPKWAWYTVAAVFYTFSIVDSLWIQGLFTFNSYTLNLENVIMIIFAILCFYKISTEMKVRQLERYPVFWINTGVLFYFSGSLLLFTLSNETISFSKTIRMYLWSVHALFVMLMYIMITIGLWVHRRS